jgi:serine protease Do
MKKIILGFVFMALLNVNTNAQEVVIIKKSDTDTSNKPLLVLDGVITYNKDVNDIEPNDIESVNVLKGEMAKNKYGSKGTKGVIEIISKKKRGVKNINENSIIIDTNLNDDIDTVINKNENLSIVIDGDKITINGKPADKNDPRLKMMGKPPIRKEGKRKKVIIEDITTNERPEMEEGSDAVMDLMEPPVPPTNTAFLGVMSEENEKGAKINSVSEDSPASKAGLKQDDIISKVNDKKIDGPKSLYEAVGTFKPNDKITITYLRDGKELTTHATLLKNKALSAPRTFSFSVPNGQMPNNLGRGFRIGPDQNFNFEMPELNNLNDLAGRNKNKPKLGISVEEIESGEGVKIKNVTVGSPAEKAGLKSNDIITAFDENKVSEINDLKWNYLQEGQVLKFNILRNGEKKKIEVKIPKKLKSADL